MQLPYRIFAKKSLPLLLADSLGILLAFLAAMVFRFDGQVPRESMRFLMIAIPWIILVYCLVNYSFNLYSHLWRYTGAAEILSIIAAAAASTSLLLVFMVAQANRRPLPLSVIILGGVLAAGLFTVIRYRQRLLTGAMARLQKVVGSPNRRRVLIVGAGEAGQFLARQVQTGSDRTVYELVGFVDDDPHKQGMRVHGVSILGGRQAIPAVVAQRGVSLIIIALHNVSGADLREILSLCLETEAKVKILPDFLGHAADPTEMLPLQDITPADLLGRQPYQIDQPACRDLIAGRVVLVTGAAGSIGSELCRQIYCFRPRQLLLLDNNESGLHDLAISFKCREAGGVEVEPVIADVTCRDKLDQIFQKHRPHLVFHAAAYKHVPLMEDYPDEAIRVNVLGTKNVADLAVHYGTERFVLVSTDKAVNPSSVMGASKRLGELIVMNQKERSKGSNGHKVANGSIAPASLLSAGPQNGYSHHPGAAFICHPAPATLFTAVRFGNVLGSRGSVVPTFIRQIEQGGPVTITHPDMTRYFMSIPEAAGLIIQAATLTTGGDIFMLDMGQQIRISDLAFKMIRLRGLRPGVDIPIVYTGIRPGEKLHEELTAADEERQATTHPHIFRIRPCGRPISAEALAAKINQLIGLPPHQQSDTIKQIPW